MPYMTESSRGPSRPNLSRKSESIETGAGAQDLSMCTKRQTRESGRTGQQRGLVKVTGGKLQELHDAAFLNEGEVLVVEYLFFGSWDACETKVFVADSHRLEEPEAGVVGSARSNEAVHKGRHSGYKCRTEAKVEFTSEAGRYTLGQRGRRDVGVPGRAFGEPVVKFREREAAVGGTVVALTVKMKHPETSLGQRAAFSLRAWVTGSRYKIHTLPVYSPPSQSTRSPHQTPLQQPYPSRRRMAAPRLAIPEQREFGLNLDSVNTRNTMYSKSRRSVHLSSAALSPKLVDTSQALYGPPGDINDAFAAYSK